MLLLQTNNVARRFGAETLFHKINFQIQDRGRVALVGRNGAGKTTLLKIIAGINPPDDGDVSMRKDCQIGYLAQDQGLSSDQTIWDEMNAVFAKLHQQERQIQQLEQQISSLDPQAANYQDVLNTYDQVQNAFLKTAVIPMKLKLKVCSTGFILKRIATKPSLIPFLVVKKHKLHSQSSCSKNPISSFWMNRLTTWTCRYSPGSKIT